MIKVLKRICISLVLVMGMGWALVTFTGMKWPPFRVHLGPGIDPNAEFQPGDFEKVYPKLVASEVQADRDKAARLLLFYGDLLLQERRKHSGLATIEDVKVVQIFLKEHAQRHPALLTNFAFVLELLKRSMEVDDIVTANAVVATLRETHPQQLVENFPCLAPASDIAKEIDQTEALAVEAAQARVSSCPDPKQAVLLVLEETAKLQQQFGEAISGNFYEKNAKDYPALRGDAASSETP